MMRWQLLGSEEQFQWTTHSRLDDADIKRLVPCQTEAFFTISSTRSDQFTAILLSDLDMASGYLNCVLFLLGIVALGVSNQLFQSTRGSVLVTSTTISRIELRTF